MRFGFIMMSILQINLFGQGIDYQKIVLPDEAVSVSFEEKLVQLAWRNNPSVLMTKKEVEIANYDAKIASSRWTGMFGAQGNLNEYTIKNLNSSGVDNNNDFYPRYNFYVNIPLSIFFENPNAKRSAYARVDVAEERVNLLKLEIRARVLKLYNDYRRNKDIWTIRQQLVKDEDSNYLLIEQNFRNGNIQVEDYLRAQKSRNDQKIQNIIDESELTRSKLELEAVIGVKLEDVESVFK